MSDFPDYVDVDYSAGEGEDPEDYPALEDKIETAVEVVRTGRETVTDISEGSDTTGD